MHQSLQKIDQDSKIDEKIQTVFSEIRDIHSDLFQPHSPQRKTILQDIKFDEHSLGSREDLP